MMGRCAICKAEAGHQPGCVYESIAEFCRRLTAWIRHGEAVPSDVTTYDRWIVHAELRQMIDDVGAARG